MNDIKILRLTQSQGAYDLISTLRSVEINSTDICNRSCSFCPQSTDNFKISKKQMSLDIIEKIGKDLLDINYNGRITFTGFGEPLLYKNLTNAIEILSVLVPSAKWIEIVTNGDYLSRDKIAILDQAGCTNITVSMYDRDISSNIIPMFEGTKIDASFKHLYKGFLETQVNRNDMLVEKIVLSGTKPCYFPFYKMIIDIDGSILLCSNDWSRSVDLGNVNKHKILDLWLGPKLTEFRKKLINGDRRSCKPCKFCNVNGTTFGHQSVDVWKSNL
jgi:radical SAM protein with 4Fe4S-binding SPASM domain